MKHIITITDKEITGSNKLSSAEPRIAVNAVLFDVGGNIALSYMGKYDLHTLPGGGVEPGEDYHVALKREIWEETGCDCEIIGDLGYINENRSEHDLTQERHYFFAHVVGKKGDLHLTDEEIAANTTVIWHPIEQALNIISEKQHDNYQRRFIQKRDIAALTTALIWVNAHDVPGYDTFVKIEPINKGWSSDKKFYIETTDVQRLFLRISDISAHDRKKADYMMIEQIYKIGVPTAQPFGFGICGNGRNIYSLSGWIDGTGADTALPLMSEAEQYALGMKAGEVLRKIHSLPAPDDAEPWGVRFRRKVKTWVDEYKSKTQVHSDIGEQLVRYLEKHNGIIDSRLQTFIHGDYNIENIIVMPNGDISVIDLSSFNTPYGDAWWDLNNMAWMPVMFPCFYTGQIKSYFNGEPPPTFWNVFACYLAYDALAALTDPYELNGIEDGTEIVKNILEWTDNFKNTVPSWYLKDFYIQYIDGVPFKLRTPFNFTFLSKYGKVFKVFDNQGSGNICFGVDNGKSKYFVKFAGAPTENYTGNPKDAVDRLKMAVPAYRDLAHTNLIRLITDEEIGGGYAVVFEWVDALYMYSPDGNQSFKHLPLETYLKIYDEVLDFHRNMVEHGYCALDFYEDHIMWDTINEKAVICDIDFYSKDWYEGMSGIWNTDCEWYFPEQYVDGAKIDEISCVYIMGATAFALFGDSRDRCNEKWKLSKELFNIAKQAVSDNRNERQQSIVQLIEEWRAAK